MYRLEAEYKIEMKKKNPEGKNIIYTGRIKEEDLTSILVYTQRGEELILSKADIAQAKAMNRIEGEENDQ